MNQEKDHSQQLWQRRVTRRRVLKGAVLGGAGLAAAAMVGCEPAPGVATPAVLRGTELKILQWSHFVPRYDKEWVDNFAETWGDANGVKVTVDHIGLAEIRTRAAAEISAGAGHDIIQFIDPPADFEPSVLDLSDVNKEAVRRFGEQVSLAKKSSFNPKTGVFYGLCHGWVIDPGNYRKSLWEKVGLPNGPSTYEELLGGGRRIKRDQGVQMGLGMSNEIDSNMAARALLWSYGTSIQDEKDKVVLNNSKAVEAVEYMVQLFKDTMTDEVFSWTAASNNELLIAGKASYILNSISAYRSAQKAQPKIAEDIFFTPALKGPGRVGFASEHVIHVAVVPKFAKNPSAAKEYLLHLLANYDQAMYFSEIYDSPSFFGTPVPTGDRKYKPVAGAKQLRDLHNAWFDDDPFRLESEAKGKLAGLKDAEKWSTNVGHPGSANAAEGETFATFVLPQMMAQAAQGKLTPKDAVAEAEKQIVAIFKKWRENGLVGGA